MQDEPFHVLQTQQYCRGEFIAWDPKITTFPGLYMLGTLYARIASCFMAAIHPKPLELACSTVGLRTLNILLVAAFYHISCKLYRRLHPGCDLQYASSMVRKFRFHSSCLFEYDIHNWPDNTLNSSMSDGL